MKHKSIVLLSAGLDSTVNLFLAKNKSDVRQTITFDYGQRALLKEIERSKKISEYLNIPHQVISLPWLKNIGESSLTNVQIQVPTGNQVSIADYKTSVQTAKSVWVPNRNGVFLNVAAAFAEAQKFDIIIPGFNLEEAETFPDNSQDFIESLNQTFSFSTSNHIQVVSYTVNMKKTEIMKIAIQENIPLKMLWPCYFSSENDLWCGQCESCLRTKRAMLENNLDIKEYFKNEAGSI